MSLADFNIYLNGIYQKANKIIKFNNNNNENSHFEKNEFYQAFLQLNIHYQNKK